MARIVLQSFGSRGDIVPFLTLAKGLKARGHSIDFATVPHYRPDIERAGLRFHPVRPHIDPTDPELLFRSMHPSRGLRYLLDEIVFPRIDETFEDSLDVVAGADLLLTGSLSFLGPLLHHVSGVPWVRCVLQPSLLLSSLDPPVLSAQLLGRLLHRFPLIYPQLLRWLRRSGFALARPLLRLERKHHFERNEHPIFAAEGSRRVLALFSHHYAQPQADWPSNTLTTGFLFEDAAPETLSPELQHFLEAGDAPVVFTLGSAALRRGAGFFRESIDAVRAVERRAVLITGSDSDRLDHLQADDLHVTSAAPHGALFRHAAAVVHHGGIGTTADAMRAAAPMLVVPFAQDQPDNAVRIERLGVGLNVAKERYYARTVQRKITRLFERPSFREIASRLAGKLEQEDGLKAACDAVEGIL